MRLIKIGLANVDTTVGAVRSNVDRCVAAAKSLAAEGATIALFPEQAIANQAETFVKSTSREGSRPTTDEEGDEPCCWRSCCC